MGISLSDDLISENSSMVCLSSYWFYYYTKDYFGSKFQAKHYKRQYITRCEKTPCLPRRSERFTKTRTKENVARLLVEKNALLWWQIR